MQLAVFPTDKRLVRVFCCFQFGGTLFLTLRMPVLLASVSLANDLMAIPTWWSWLINCIVEVVANCWCSSTWRRRSSATAAAQRRR